MSVYRHRLHLVFVFLLAGPVFAAKDRCVNDSADYLGVPRPGEITDLIAAAYEQAPLHTESADARVARLDKKYDGFQAVAASGEGKIIKVYDSATKKYKILKVGNSEGAMRAEVALTQFLNRRYREGHGADAKAPLLDCTYSPEDGAIVMEPGAFDMWKYLGAAVDKPMSDRLHFTQQMVDAIAFLHEQGVVHLDLKPSNFLIMSDGTVHVIDLGFASEAGRHRKSREGRRSGVGTADFMHPDQIRNQPPSPHMDVYAARLTLTAVMLGKYPDGVGTVPRRLYYTDERGAQQAKTFGVWAQSVHSTDSTISPAVSAALWHPAKNMVEMKALYDQAVRYGQDSDAFFKEAYRPYWEELVRRDAQEAARTLLTSKELVAAAQKGLLRLEEPLETNLWKASKKLYEVLDRPESQFDNVPGPEYPLPPLDLPEFRQLVQNPPHPPTPWWERIWRGPRR